MTIEEYDEDGDYPDYPSTPDEYRDSFIAQARWVEESLFELSQDLYSQLSQIWNEQEPKTHTQALEDMKRVFQERISAVGYGDHLAEAAAAADRAWGMSPSGQGESPATPHT